MAGRYSARTLSPTGFDKAAAGRPYSTRRPAMFNFVQLEQMG